MSKSKVQMPQNLEIQCHAAIHTATTAAGAAGAIPLPMSDALPITATQITMIIALGKIFGMSLTRAAAKAIAGVGVTHLAGGMIFSNFLKGIH